MCIRDSYKLVCDLSKPVYEPGNAVSERGISDCRTFKPVCEQCKLVFEPIKPDCEPGKPHCDRYKLVCELGKPITSLASRLQTGQAVYEPGNAISERGKLD